jgi:hypothetical protein
MTENLFTHEGVTYRKVSRKANIGEKLLITKSLAFTTQGVPYEVIAHENEWHEDDVVIIDDTVGEHIISLNNYVVLEPIADSADLTLTEADVRNNPRQVIDLIANLAGRQTKSESTIEFLTDKLNIANKLLIDAHDRIDRLASANEQAVSTVARNVETWAQEVEGLRKKLDEVNERTQPYQQAHELFVKIVEGVNGRGLTAEERREL